MNEIERSLRLADDGSDLILGRQSGVVCFRRTSAPSLAGSRFEWERLNPTGFPGNVGLGSVSSRYLLLSTGLTPLYLFNPRVVEQQTGLASVGTNLNTCC